MTLYWILWIFTAVMSLIPVYFFFVGLKDGSITWRNLSLWALILLIIAAVLIGSTWLKNHDRLAIAKGILVVASIPGIITILYFLVVITSKAKWN